MHLDIIVEGIADQIEEFEKWWSTRTALMPVEMPDGTETKASIQIALRKRQAYSLIFPKEFLHPVLNTLNPEDRVVSRVDGKGTKQFRTFFNLIRKALRLKKIPKRDPTLGYLPCRPFKDVRIVALGVREDQTEVTEKDGSKHEGI
jgi:hypothetical protein